MVAASSYLRCDSVVTCRKQAQVRVMNEGNPSDYPTGALAMSEATDCLMAPLEMIGAI